jgi:hypothetical protein
MPGAVAWQIDWRRKRTGLMIRILILRDRAYSGFLSAMVIEVDGKTAGKVRRGGRVEFEIPPGEHMITARMHWLRSETIPIPAEGDDHLRFVCGCRGYGGSMQAWLRQAGFEYHLV